MSDTTDVYSAEKRSAVMRRVKGKDTAPEMIVRKALTRLGVRYRLHRKDLPGCPDVVMPARRLAIFVHGCFWHAHENCEYFRLPKTRKAWWRAKLVKNKERDALVEKALIESGWNVVTIWECATKTKLDREWLLDRLPMLIG